MNYKLLILTLFLILLFPFFSALAVQKTGNCGVSCEVGGVFDPNEQLDVDCACCGNCKLASFTRLAVQSSKIIMGLVGSLALLFFVYGGLTWLTAAGASEKIEKGKKILTGAVIGVIIVLGAYLLINFTVQALTGMTLDKIQEWGMQTPASGTQKK